MPENQNFRPTSVVGPLGETITLDTIPRADTTRWVARRKAEVVAAVTGRLLSVGDALRRYRLSLEEFESWHTTLHRVGVPGLRITHTQDHGHVRKRRG